MKKQWTKRHLFGIAGAVLLSVPIIGGIESSIKSYEADTGRPVHTAIIQSNDPVHQVGRNDVLYISPTGEQTVYRDADVRDSHKCRFGCIDVGFELNEDSTKWETRDAREFIMDLGVDDWKDPETFMYVINGSNSGTVQGSYEKTRHGIYTFIEDNGARWVFGKRASDILASQERQMRAISNESVDGYINRVTKLACSNLMNSQELTRKEIARWFDWAGNKLPSTSQNEFALRNMNRTILGQKVDKAMHRHCPEVISIIEQREELAEELTWGFINFLGQAFLHSL